MLDDGQNFYLKALFWKKNRCAEFKLSGKTSMAIKPHDSKWYRKHLIKIIKIRQKTVSFPAAVSLISCDFN